MPYLVATSIYPSAKATEVAEKYLEVLAKFPHDESLGTTLVPVAMKSTHQGIRTFGVTEILDGKLDASYKRDANMMAMFNDIEGFSYTNEVYMTLEEAMSTIGMSMP